MCGAIFFVLKMPPQESSLAREVFPTGCDEPLAAALGIDESNSFAPGERSDTCNAYICDRPRDSGGRRRGEKQLVVFAAMKREREGIAASRGQRMNRKCGGDNFRAEMRFLAEVGEVGGEAVAKVDTCGGESATEQSLADGQARLRVQMGVRSGVDLPWHEADP